MNIIIGSLLTVALLVLPFFFVKMIMKYEDEEDFIKEGDEIELDEMESAIS